VVISVINLGMKIGILAGVFLLIKKPEDAVLYAGLLGGGYLLAGLTGAIASFKMFKLRLMRVSAEGIREVLKEGWTLFLSKASVSLYTAGNAFILGMLTNHTAVGYYSASEKLVRAVTSLLNPLTQSAYPAFSKIYKTNFERYSTWVKFGLLLQILGGTFLTVILMIGAFPITKVLFDKDYYYIAEIVKLFAFLPLLISISKAIGAFILLPQKKDKERLYALTVGGLLNIIIALIFVPVWDVKGMVMSVLISEFSVTVLYVYFGKKFIK